MHIMTYFWQHLDYEFLNLSWNGCMGPISQTFFFPFQLKCNGKLVLMWLHCRVSYHYKILHMPWEHSCCATVLSCHVQSFIEITSLQLGSEQNEISMEFELWWNRIRWLCLFPTSTTRFACVLGYRMAKNFIGLYKENTFSEQWRQIP